MTVKVTVANIRDGAKGEYIGRASRGRKPSPLANPYRVKEHGREGAIRLYEDWLFRRLLKWERDCPLWAEIERLTELAKRPEGVTLLCWCAPERCHGDVIKGWIGG